MTATAPKIMHLFFDVWLGYGHKSLNEIMENVTGSTELKKNEVAVFINKAWTGAKMLGANGTMLYWKSPNNRPISVEELKDVPTNLGAQRFVFSGKLEQGTSKGYSDRFGTARVTKSGSGRRVEEEVRA